MRGFGVAVVVGTVSAALVLSACGRTDPSDRAQAQADETAITAVAVHVGPQWTPVQHLTSLTCGGLNPNDRFTESIATWKTAPTTAAVALVTQVTDFLTTTGWAVAAPPSGSGASAYASLSMGQADFMVRYGAPVIELEIDAPCTDGGSISLLR